MVGSEKLVRGSQPGLQQLLQSALVEPVAARHDSHRLTQRGDVLQRVTFNQYQVCALPRRDLAESVCAAEMLRGELTRVARSGDQCFVRRQASFHQQTQVVVN